MKILEFDFFEYGVWKMISFQLTEEQKAIINLAKSFAKNELIPNAHEYDEKEELPWEIVKKAFDVGLMNLNIPEEYGGPGLDLITTTMVIEELCYGCAGITTTIGANALALTPLLIAGTAEQKEKFLRPMTREFKLAAFGLTEPGAGSDPAALSTTAKRDGNNYILNGTKCFISNGGIADIYTIFATVDKKKGIKGISAFVVTADTPCIFGGKKEKKMGIRASVTAEVILEDCVVPAENLLGKEGEGFTLAMHTLNHARISTASGAIGVSRRALDLAVEYAKTRVQFGKPIGYNQGVSFMLADMAIAIEVGRNMIWKAAWLADQGLPFAKESAICKTFCTDVGVQVTNMALQVFGGYGYTREYPLEKLVRDARIYPIVEGTNQIQRMIISGALMRD